VAIPVCEAESLLNTKYSVYRHEDGTEVIRTPEWSLPRDLHQHVVAIQPTNSFLRAAPRKTNFKPVLPDGVALTDAPEIPGIQKLYVNTDAATTGAAADPSVQDVCNAAAVTPACLRTLYKTIDYVPKATDKNSVGFANYLNETAMMPDVAKYLQRYRPDAVDAKINYTLINNGENMQVLTPEKAAKQQNAEGNLDGETLIAFVHPMTVHAFNTGGSPPFKPDAFTKSNTNEPYLEWLEYMLAPGHFVPQTISTSYGDDEQTVPRSYAELVCQKMAVLGSRGVTLLFASGDNGVGGEGSCVSNDGKETAGFLPSYPDSCPYVTSVGGTKGFAPEVAAWHDINHFASGGGYSNYFARPDYQNKVVSAYTKNLGAMYPNMYNASGRAYPDIAAQGQSYAIVWNGMNIQLDGTSASTPTMAGVIALLNDHLIANGKASLGFMNPWLYSVGFQAFNDITSGSSKGCGTDGFPAAVGWDAVTGFGTPVRVFLAAGFEK
jgi:tripeptidyl-peptidase-1